MGGTVRVGQARGFDQNYHIRRINDTSLKSQRKAGTLVYPNVTKEIAHYSDEIIYDEDLTM